MQPRRTTIDGVGSKRALHIVAMMSRASLCRGVEGSAHRSSSASIDMFLFVAVVALCAEQALPRVECGGSTMFSCPLTVAFGGALGDRALITSFCALGPCVSFGQVGRVDVATALLNHLTLVRARVPTHLSCASSSCSSVFSEAAWRSTRSGSHRPGERATERPALRRWDLSNINARVCAHGSDVDETRLEPL